MEKFKTLIFLSFLLLLPFKIFSQRLDSLIDESKRLLICKENDSAKIVLDEALMLAEKQGEIRGQGDIHNNLGIYFKRIGNYAQSIEQYNRALFFYREYENDTLIANTTYNFSLVLKKKALYDEAIENLLTAVTIFQNIKDTTFEAKALDAIGNLYYSLKDFKQSDIYHKQALRLFRIQTNQYEAGRVLHNMAELYIATDSLKQAAIYLNQAIAIKKEQNVSLTSLYVLRGELLVKQEKWDSAFYYYESTLVERKLNNETDKLASSYYHFGEYYYQLNEFDLGQKYLDSAYVIADSLGQNQLLSSIIELQIEVLNAVGESELLNIKYRELLQFKEVFLGEQIRNRAVYFNSQLKLLNNERELEFQANKNEVQLLENKNLNAKNKFLLGSVIVILLFVLIVFFFSLRMRHKNELLNTKNELLKSKNETIQELHHELNHRTKNYYQMLTGMLWYDIDFAFNSETKVMLERYVSRVESMAQIQHYLINENDGSETVVRLDVYLTNLMDQIDLALNHSTPKVVIHKKFESIHLDYNRVCYLGITLNELLQNAFKHSFKGIKEPEIKVVLEEKTSVIKLMIEDNGVGMNARDGDIKQSNGLKLIALLVNKIKGDLVYDSTRDNGVKITLIIPR